MSVLMTSVSPFWSPRKEGESSWQQNLWLCFNEDLFVPAVEVKIEVVIPEKERSKEEMSPNGKASPLIYKVNGTARHYHLEEHPIASNPYHNPKDVVEASVCHVKDLENGQ